MKKKGFLLVFIIPVVFLLIMSCAGLGTPVPASGQLMSSYIEEEYSLLIEVNSVAAYAGKFDSIAIEIDGSKLTFKVEPLFPAEDALDDLYNYRESSHWLVLQHVAGEGAMNRNIHPWSLAHKLIRKIEDNLHEDILTIEADIHHHWYFDDFRRHLFVPPACTMNPPLGYWPVIKEFAWHLDDAHSQLKSAREHVANSDHLPVRIAHLDTGYDPLQMTFPLDRMRLDLGYNFYEKNTNAQDPGISGIFKQPGHGTGTLGILAGGAIHWLPHFGYPEFDGYLGAARTADIVPVRIYPSVVHFKTRYMTQGIYYAISPRGDTANICNVVSLSMGGVASRAWADAVNLAYEAGVAIFAASGDRFGISPPATTVYPARFHRVVSVCGATAEYTPYYKKCNLYKLQESYGPDEVMKNSIAAYAPNVPWAKYECEELINLDGGGTSVSTPQVAGAAALWLQMHGADYENDWKKVEAVRTALFQTAKKDIPGMTEEKVFTYFGNGIVRAMDALNYKPDPDKLVKQPEDTVHFPLITLLLEYFESFFKKQEISRSLWKKIIAMYELEMIQLHTGNAVLQKILFDHETETLNISKSTLKKYVKALSKHVKASDELKEVMQYIYNVLI